MEFVLSGMQRHVLKNLQGVFSSVQSETLDFPIKNHHFEGVRMGNNKLLLVQVVSLALFRTVACRKKGTEPEQSINLDPPSELQPTRIPGRAAVRLSWNNYSNSETGRAIDSIGLRIGATYSYRVRAMRYAESSAPSNVASITLTP
jgi:hypothetical protein